MGVGAARPGAKTPPPSLPSPPASNQSPAHPPPSGDPTASVWGAERGESSGCCADGGVQGAIALSRLAHIKPIWHAHSEPVTPPHPLSVFMPANARPRPTLPLMGGNPHQALALAFRPCPALLPPFTSLSLPHNPPLVPPGPVAWSV